jgi:hypothetical protein
MTAAQPSGGRVGTMLEAMVIVRQASVDPAWRQWKAAHHGSARKRPYSQSDENVSGCPSGLNRLPAVAGGTRLCILGFKISVSCRHKI